MYKILIMALAVCFVSVHAGVLKRDEEQTEESVTLGELKKQAETNLVDSVGELNNFFKYCDDGFQNFVKESTDELKEFGEYVHETFVNLKKFVGGKFLMARKNITDEVEKVWKESNGEKNKVKDILDKIEIKKKITHDDIEVGKKHVNELLALKSKLSHNVLENAKKKIMDQLKQLETEQ